MPPTPPPSQVIEPTTLDAEGVTLEPEMKKKLAGLAAERDEQHGKNTSTTEWRDLFDRARQLFREAALPRNVSRLLTRVFSVRKIPGANCETVLARVLAQS